MPPCVERIRYSFPPSNAGSHPIPAFCVHPNKSPDGRSRSISAVSGSVPAGPATRVRTFMSSSSSKSNGLDVIVGVFRVGFRIVSLLAGGFDPATVGVPSDWPHYLAGFRGTHLSPKGARHLSPQLFVIRG